jgi:hypothetical protein
MGNERIEKWNKYFMQRWKGWLVWFVTIIFLLWSVETGNKKWFFLGMIVFGIVRTRKYLWDQILLWKILLIAEWNNKQGKDEDGRRKQI